MRRVAGHLPRAVAQLRARRLLDQHAAADVVQLAGDQKEAK